MKIKEALTYDDVLLVPTYSEVKSRSDVDLSVTIKFGKSPKEFTISHPIIPANMKTVTGLEMAKTVISSGGLPILHRFYPTLEEQIDIARELTPQGSVGFSVGVKDIDREIACRFVDVGVEILCVDVAHGDSKNCVDMVEWIRNSYPDVLIIAGNVATPSGAQRLWEAGANVLKVGVGPGSLCTTRIETGNGVPQLTALVDVAEVKSTIKTDRPLYLIADGGIKNPGDIVKALCFADMVMVGNMFAGCDETPGHKILVNGREYKEYVGSSTHKTNHIEGVAALVPTKGSYAKVLNDTLEGIRSGLSYQGVFNLKELQKDPQFVRITSAGLLESHPHDVIVT